MENFEETVRVAEMLLLVKVDTNVDGLGFVHKLSDQLSAPELIHGAHKAGVLLELNISVRTMIDKSIIK